MSNMKLKKFLNSRVEVTKKISVPSHSLITKFSQKLNYKNRHSAENNSNLSDANKLRVLSSFAIIPSSGIFNTNT